MFVGSEAAALQLCSPANTLQYGYSETRWLRGCAQCFEHCRCKSFFSLLCWILFFARRNHLNNERTRLLPASRMEENRKRVWVSGWESVQEDEYLHLKRCSIFHKLCSRKTNSVNKWVCKRCGDTKITSSRHIRRKLCCRILECSSSLFQALVSDSDNNYVYFYCSVGSIALIGRHTYAVVAHTPKATSITCRKWSPWA